ncbi:MAG: winged helix family transcriptional regulator [Variovorax sp.]|nr:MAG: winged helix family transcriptional regulator [Variovorax sp.]
MSSFDPSSMYHPAPQRQISRFTFGPYTIDRVARQLWVAGQERHLEPKAFDLLLYLIDHRTRVIDRQELLYEIWNTHFLSDSVLPRAIMKARRALQIADAADLIETVYGVGYRFVGDLAPDPEESQPVRAKLHRTGERDPAWTQPRVADPFAAEVLARCAQALEEQRYATALQCIDVFMAEASSPLHLEVESVVRLAAALDVRTSFRAAAVLAAATEKNEPLAQARFFAPWPAISSFAVTRPGRAAWRPRR